ncbi:MAG: hypothetical protein KJ000_30695 [Pirellulaceae bacterium]|nr:hypothetical protein [Pirellulaceae bacterium]
MSASGLLGRLDRRDCDISDSRLNTLCDRDAASLGVRAEGKSTGVRAAADGAGRGVLDASPRFCDEVIRGTDGVEREMLGTLVDGCGGLPAWFEGVRPKMLGRLASVGGRVTPGDDGADRLTLGVLERSGRTLPLGTGGADRVTRDASTDGLARLGAMPGDCRVVALDDPERDRIGLDDGLAGPRITGDKGDDAVGPLRAGVREGLAPWNERTPSVDRDTLGREDTEDRLGPLGDRVMLGAELRDAGAGRDLAEGVGADREMDAEGLDGARDSGRDRLELPDDLDIWLNDWPRPRDGASAAATTPVAVRVVNRATHPARDAQRFWYRYRYIAFSPILG